MSDLIKREDAVGAINGWLKLNHFPEFGDGILYLVPSADRPQGEWIPNSPFTGNCSECGADGNLKDNYCSNCGARMEGAV